MMRTAYRLTVGSVVRWSGLVSIAYHRIGDWRRSPGDRDIFSADAEQFDRQVRFLKSSFDVIGPADLGYVQRVRRGRHVIISFDDGYVDNYRLALPILQAHRAQATFFVTSGFVDRQQLAWWDQMAQMVRTSAKPRITLPAFFPDPVVLDPPEHEEAIRMVLFMYKKFPASRAVEYMEALATATGVEPPAISDEWMTWDMVRALRDAGMTIGGHAIHHQLLSRMPLDEQWEEIAGCARRYEEELGAPMRYFAYPGGRVDSFNDETRRCLDRAGVRFAFSYYGGFRRVEEWDRYDMRRIQIERDMSMLEFRGRLMTPWR
jgi:peptidoglycan/xylan/chitin deacetylase (PgdA/CDA1 family)